MQELEESDYKTALLLRSRDCRGYGDALASACTTFGSWKLVMVAGKSETEPGRGRKDPYGGGGENDGREEERSGQGASKTHTYEVCT